MLLCVSHRLPLLLRAGSGRLTLLWGELRQLLLLQRVKDERTSGDLEMYNTNTPTNKTWGSNRHGEMRMKEGSETERGQAEGEA